MFTILKSFRDWQCVMYVFWKALNKKDILMFDISFQSIFKESSIPIFWSN